MSQVGAKPGSEIGTTVGSATSTEKYPASSGNENYPEVAPRMHQPPLQSAYAQNPYPQAPYPPPSQDALNPQTPYQYQTPAKNDIYQPQDQQKRNPWGMSPLAFGLLVAIFTALVVGGAVGGGVAGAMSGKNDSSSSVAFQTVTVTAGGATATSTASGTQTSSGLPEPSSLRSFQAPAPYYVATLFDPGCQESRINVQYDERYDLSCGIDMGNNLKDQDDNSKVVADVAGIFAYSITDCLYACANVNHFTDQWKTGTAQRCKGVTWNYNMAANNASNSANCWLKNGTSTGYQCNSCISGVLV